MFRDNSEKFQIFVALIQESMGASPWAVVNHSRDKGFRSAVAEGDTFSGSNEDYLAGGFVAMLADGMTGGKTPEKYFVVSVRLYTGEQFAFATSRPSGICCCDLSDREETGGLCY